MNFNDAQHILDQGKPCESQRVNICCHSCLGQWSSSSKDYGSGIVHENYVGLKDLVPEEIELSDSQHDSYCPNGCIESNGSRVILKLMCNVDVPSPLDRYNCAKLIVEKNRLIKRTEEIDKELECYSSMFMG